MNPEDNRILIRYRLEQAETAFQDAQYLFDGNRSTQSVINRCYYAMYYSALALLQSISRVPSKHTGVISLFDTEFVMKGLFNKELSRDFHRIFQLRQISDYKADHPISVERTKELLEKTSVFLALVKKYFESQ